MEIWKEIKGFEGYYEVSDLGRVRRLDRYDYGCGYARFYKGRILKNLTYKTTGYLHVQLCKSGTIVNKSVHRLVAEAFIPNPDNLPQVNHKDEDKSNNCVDNLEWCDVTYNMNYGTKQQRTNKTKIERGLADPETVGNTHKESMKLYAEKHKDEIKLKSHQYYIENQERIKTRRKEYYWKNRDKILARICKNHK